MSSTEHENTEHDNTEHENTTAGPDNEQRLRDYLKRATSELRSTRAALDEERAARETPLAIVSMACRFPGGIATPEGLWEALTEGRDLVGPFPTDRGWDLDRLFDDDPEHLGTSYAREGAFLDGATGFDAGFFEVSPREALAMDPQQRLLLETSWEAFERAGLDPHTLRGRALGVYVGASNQGYGAVAPAAQADVEGHVLTGTSGAVVSGRLAYTFGLEGPAVTVDTMCSSSLVALHLAAQAIRAGECEAALVGGATVMAGPRNFVEFSRQRGLAPDGRCKPFAAGADGTGWGEAVGVLVVEPLEAARAAGHPVLAVLRGTAINSDGASNGLTAPNGPAQQRVIRDALQRSGLEPHDVDVVEAHGTGTELGDPIEAQALLATYGQGREAPLLLGALKGATGHTQAASGIAGVIKTVLALQHSELPATLHVDAPSPHVDWTAGSVELLTEPRPWAPGDRPRRAGISSFGGSGTNSHAVVEEAPEEPNPGVGVAATPTSGDRKAVGSPWVLSARDADALSATAAGLAGIDAPVPDVAAALAARSTFEHRAVVLDGDTDGLRAVAAGGVPERGARGRTVAQSDVPVFVFPGQGAQWVGMGAELLASDDHLGGAFADRLRECSAAVVAAGGPDVARVIADGEELDDVAVVQPVSWAVMVALAAAWEAAGIEPGAVVGHSQGEIAAAVVAGALSVADGARVVTARAQALRAVAGSGAMGSLGETEDAARARVAGLGDAAEGVEVAAVNGPSSVVVAGPVAGVEAVLASAEADGRRARRIAVDYASHTPGMEPLRAPVTDALAGITPAAPRVPWFSTHDADWIDDDRAGADYWFANLRDTVRFADAIAALTGDGFDAFVEVSAHPVLAHAVVEVADSMDGAEVSATGTLRRDDGGPARLLVAIGEAWAGGLDVDWTRLAGGADPRAVALPTYPFTRRRFWLDPVGAAELAGAARDPLDEEFWAAVEARDAVALAGDDPDGTIARALPVLADWRRRRTAAATQDAWRYRITWSEHPRAGASTDASGPWILARPPGDDAAAVRAALGDDAVVDLVVDPADTRSVLAERLTALVAEHGVPTAVVSVLAADVADHPTLTGLPAGLVATLHLLQAVTDLDVDTRLWALTTGAESTGPDDRPARPLEAAIWGLGRVAALEHPDRWGGLVDLSAGADMTLLPAILTDPEEDQVALRGDRVLVRRLERAPRTAGATEYRSRGTALVTGGTGGLGAHTARLLARTGTEHLVLTSRRGPDAPGAEELRAELAEMGARVTVAAVDATDPDAVRALVEGIEADGETVRTVAHTAGVGILVAIADTTDEQFVDGAVGKLAGARVLDALFDAERGAALDAFVLFSSVAGLWGSGEHGAYSASNAVVDAMAGERRARGLPGTSIPWGIWEASGGGMGQDVVSTQLKWRGIRFMTPDLAIGAMADLLVDDESLLAVADIDWDVFAPVFTASRRRPLLDGVPDVATALSGGTASSDDEGGGAPGSALRARLGTAADPQRVLRDAVREAVGRALSFEDAAAVDPDRAFRELGVDSLTAVALRNGVQAETGVRLPVTVVFDHPTVTALARHLGEEMGVGSAAAPSVTPATGPVIDADDPTVITGMACRFPGEIRTPEALWELLAAGGDVVSGFPTDRGWDLDGLYDPDPDREGTVYTREGGFLHDAGWFDPEFFGISPREALAMDPQQRLLLETSWEALERAGIDPRAADGARTGVFVGAAYQGYGTGGSGGGRAPEGFEGHMVTGTATSVASGRVAYALGLEGPAVTLDTACSSSLVALHQATQALRDGDCDRALVGGVAVMVAPVGLLGFSRQRGLAVDGRCKAFAAAADGMGLAEGAGMVTVERLSTARAAGRPVLAVVRATAINQDGASNGLSAPSGVAQQRVIRAALSRAGLTAADVDAVEAHGTGTTLGDPIEAQALLATYGSVERAEPLWLGSVKSNIGHTQAAAGVAGLMKTVLAMRHGTLPATLHVDAPSPHVEWDSGAVELVTEARPWERGDRPRRAAVSSFGVSGTNAHVILEEPPGTSDAASPADPRQHAETPWPVSARTDDALDDALAALGALDVDPDAVAAVLARRAVFERRAVLDGATGEELARGAGDPARSTSPVFVFPGQGAQWAGMGADLLDAEGPLATAFADRLRECSTAVVAAGGPDVEAALRDRDDLADVGVVQPVSWAVMVALAALWDAAGVRPTAVVGHSQGEIAAAVVAGALSVGDGARIVTVRAQALRGVAGTGTMGSVAESAEDVAARVEGAAAEVSVAARNAPRATVVSGPVEAVEALLAAAEADGVRARRLPVDYASHSALMEPLRDEVVAAIGDVTTATPDVPWYSTVTPRWVDEPLPAGYWMDNLRSTVRFADAVEALVAEGHDAFVDVSAHPVLATAVGETAEAVGVPVSATGTLRRDTDGPARVVAALAEAWVGGVAVDWAGLLPGGPGHADVVPTYPFRRRHLWLELEAPAAAAPVEQAGWTYRESWAPVTVPGRARLEGTWAVVGDDPSVAAALAAAGATVTSDLSVTDLAGVLVVPAGGAGAERVLAVTAVLDAVDAAPVWVLTRQGVAAGAADDVDPAAAALWGLGRIAAQEQPDRWGGLVDVPADLDELAGRRLAAVLSGAVAGEDQVAIRPAGALARRLTRLTAPERGTPLTGTVLVTGGTGALGAHVARRLAAGGASRLVLTSRRGPDAPGAEELAAELGADIRALDVADRDALAALLDEIDPDAVVHTAGVVDDALLGDLTADQLERVLAPKLDAARALDELTRDRDLKAFVLFSSLAGSLGGPGQGAYAAANAAVDAIARDRHRAGLPATAVGWGAWAGGGLAAGSEERMTRDGVTPMEPGAALDVLASVVGGPEPVVLVADVDWSRHAEVLTGSRPLAALRGLPEAAAVAGAVPGGSSGGDTAAPALDGIAPEERPAAVLDLVRRLAAASLSLAGPEEVAPDRAFRDLGFDSLTAVDLRNRLIRAVDVRLPVTLVFDHPTAGELAEHLLEKLGASASASAAADVPADAPVVAAAEGDDIAIVAMSCRLPGGVGTPEDLWALLEREGDAVVGFPTDRGWDVAGRYHPDPQHAGSFATTGGGFLDDPAGFDAAFFGISPREALTIDPQQRLLLETAWEAFERAGIVPASVRGSRTGVFVGSNYHDYGSRLAAEPGVFEGQLATGSAGSVASGRVAYTFGLQGPAVTVDTACSSSLVAMHWAASALRSGECSMALAGGVTVISSLDTFVEFSRQGALSPDGRCRAFSEDADGAGWAEGVGLVLLERLSDARAAGHPVLGVLRGSAVNSDGASNGLTAPNGPAQQRVIRDALASGGVSAADVDAVEAHGTGTSLGDPIEAQALLATYGAADRANPLLLGSVKSNLGHTQAAAGVAGVIKAVLALQHGVVPASLHAQTPSSRIEWDTGDVAIASTATDLPTDLDRPWRVGVSSFGISGTNAHVVLESVASDAASLVSEARIATSSVRDTPWVVSARSRSALDAAVERLRAWTSGRDVDAAAVGSALAGRTWFDERAVLLGDSRDERVEGSVRSGATVVVLPGQGAQRPGMGRELGAAFPVFAEAFDAAIAAVDAQLSEGSLREVLWGEDAEQLNRTQWAQPALFVMQVAGFRLLESWGLTNPTLVGHSVGEIAAAHLSGALDLADAARLVVARGRLMGALPEGGSMAAVSGEVDVENLPESVSVAAYNSASSLVLSGETEALEQVLGGLPETARVSRLHTSHAFHSPLMAPAADDLAAVAAELTWSVPTLTVISTVTGEPVGQGTWSDPRHWATQLIAPVRFADAIAVANPARVVEVGPKASLTGHVAADHPETPTTCLGDGDRAAAVLWTSGEDLTGWVPAPGASLDLPTYPFEHQRFWLDAPAATTPASLGLGATGHPLLGGHLVLAGGEEHVLTGRLGTRSHPWLADHALGDTAILPATAYVELAQDAARRAIGDGAGLADLTIQAPLVLPANGDGVEVQVRVGAPDQDGLRTVTVDARTDAAPWTRHADGAVGPITVTGATVDTDLTTWPPAGAEPLDVTDLYDRTAAAGFAYGPAFRALRAAWRAADGAVLAEIALDEAAAADAGGCVVHPALLDAALHTVALDAHPDDGAVMPFAVRDVAISTPGARALRVAMTRTDDTTVSLDLADGDGRALGRLGAATLRPVPTGELRAAGPRPLYRTEHVALDDPQPATGEVRRAAATALADLDVLGDDVAAVLVGAPVPGAGDTADRIREASVATLAMVQAWLARPDDAASARLVVATGADDPAAAAAAGLLRTAQAENPDRIVILDAADDPGDTAVRRAVASGEPQVTVQPDGTLTVPRLHRADVTDAHEPGWDGTVVVTGGTGALGAAVARHVVSAHGVGRIVLVSRRGPDAEGADALRTDLTEHGADVEIVAADLATDDGIAAVLAAAGPVHTIVHTAGIVDDGPVETLTAERVAPVLAPKADAALRLLDAAPGARLVLFSSLAGTFGGVGQGNYAAANAALDAIACGARAGGRDVTSVVWGLWAVPSGLTGGLTDVDRRRLERGGLAPMETTEALDLLDVALGLDDAVTVAARLDVAALRLATGSVPPLLADLAPATRTSTPADPTPVASAPDGPEQLATRLRGTSDDERTTILLDLVRGEAAGVLGHASPDAIPVDQGFLDLGFESLTAVELRNRLAAATGLRLPATVLFDHPDPQRLAGLLDEKLPREDGAPADDGHPGLAEVDRLQHVVAGLNGDTATRETLARRLTELLDELGVDPAQDTARRVEDASDDELFAMIDAD